MRAPARNNTGPGVQAAWTRPYRAPFTFGMHADICSKQYGAKVANSTAAERQQALAEVLDYALGKTEVRVVSAA